MMKILSIVGARPNFMKVAPIITAIRDHNAKAAEAGANKSSGQLLHKLVHTGQHYDKMMSDAFFNDLDLPKPDIFLGVGSGSHAAQTAEIMMRFEPVLLQEKPDVVIVVGDVNSTVACALVASKTAIDPHGKRPLIAHVEAGLRSFDRSMPEEINRILTDHVSDMLFVTEESGIENLRREGIPEDKIHFVGNTMIDTLLAFEKKADQSSILSQLGLGNNHGGKLLQGENNIVPFALLTLHRPSNVDDRETFVHIVDALSELASDLPIVFPVHPRTRQRVKEYALESFFCNGNPNEAIKNEGLCANGKIVLIDPLGYLDFLCLMKNAEIVLTDSGGIQEETTFLGVPCITIRENTERPVTVTHGTNILTRVNKSDLKEAFDRQLKRSVRRDRVMPKNWDGRAAVRIIDIINDKVMMAFPAVAGKTSILPSGQHQNSK